MYTAVCGQYLLHNCSGPPPRCLIAGYHLPHASLQALVGRLRAWLLTRALTCTEKRCCCRLSCQSACCSIQDTLLQAVMVRLSARLLKKALTFTDDRAKVERELLDGMDVVKCSAWEVGAAVACE